MSIVRKTRSSWTRARIIFSFGLLLVAAVTALSITTTLDSQNGSDATAEIVNVEHGGLKTFFTVRFTTDDGKQCKSYFRSARDEPTAKVGDLIRIHHPGRIPCVNVQDASESVSWAPTVLGVLFTVGLAVGAFVAWRRPTFPPPRYEGMP